MTTTVLVLGTTLVGLLLFGVVIVALAIQQAKQRGRLEAEAEHNQRAAENAEAMGKVLAESRDPDGPGDSDRMRDGTF